jgi:hypothetical protein
MKISPTTQENYRYTLRILTGYFGRRHLNSIKPYDIEAFMRKLRNDGRSDSYLAKCKALMFQIMNKAEGNDLIRKNPVRFAEKLRRLPHKKGKETLLKRFAEMEETVVFYESPHRLLKTLEKMVEVMGGEHPVAVAKELTKIHSFTFRGTLAEAVQYFGNQPVKGEFVLIV